MSPTFRTIYEATIPVEIRSVFHAGNTALLDLVEREHFLGVKLNRVCHLQIIIYSTRKKCIIFRTINNMCVLGESLILEQIIIELNCAG